MALLHYRKSEKVFVFEGAYHERSLPREAGFRWNRELKIWYTDFLTVAAKLRSIASDEAKKEIDSAFIKIEPWPSPLLPLPPGLSLYPHQAEALYFALQRNRAYLGLDPGLGKTIVAARIASELKGYGVYICPPFLVQNTITELRKWGTKLFPATYRKTKNGREAPNYQLSNVFVVPDSLLIRPETIEDIVDFVSEMPGSFLIVDEAHRYKNPEAKRTRALFQKIRPHFDREYYMSGTPMPSRPMELYPVLSEVAPESIDFANQYEYGRKFCAGFRNEFGWDFTGASNLPDLRRRVIAPSGKFMIRMKKDLLDLPRKIVGTFSLTGELTEKAKLLEKKFIEFLGGPDHLRDEDFIKQLVAHSAGKSEDELHLATYQRLIGGHKVGPATEFIEEILSDFPEESVLVFAKHRDVVASLKEKLKTFDPLVITGETPMKDRSELVEKFQTSGLKNRVFIGNYHAMGVGLTLTKATRVIFVEFDWVPGVNEQAEDRTHRIGQKNTVLVHYLVYENSIDKAVIETLLRKRNNTQYV